jgi:hypothetical protein
LRPIAGDVDSGVGVGKSGVPTVGDRCGEEVLVAWPPHAVSTIPAITMPLTSINRYEVLAADMLFSPTFTGLVPVKV